MPKYGTSQSPFFEAKFFIGLTVEVPNLNNYGVALVFTKAVILDIFPMKQSNVPLL